MKKTLILFAAFAAVVPAAVISQPQFLSGPPGGGAGRPERPAWQEFKLDSKKKVQLSFRNASVDAIVDLLSRQSGIAIVKDPALNTPMTLTTPKAVSLNEAFGILNSALGLRGFEMAKDGTVLVIRKKQERPARNFDPSQLAGMMPQQSNSDLKVYRIKYASASEVARVVNEVFLQQQQMGLGFPGMMMGGGNRFGGMRGGMSFSFPGMNNQNQASVRASSDDYSNTVIVNAPKDKQLEVEALIEEIDKQTDQPLTTKAYKLEFAAAADLVNVVQGVLQSNAPRGKGGASQQNSRNSFFDLISGRGNQGQASVTADDRSNTLVVTTTTDNQKIVDQLVKDLDQKVEVANTTFFFPLRNAKADAVAQLLQSAFGTRSGSGTTTNRNSSTTNRNNSTTNRNNTTNRNSSNGRAVNDSAPADSQSLNLPLNGDASDEEALLTNVYVQQGGFRFGGGMGQNRNSSSSGLVRGSDGRQTNQRDLTNQVTVIADTNTNGLVVVTSPDNVDILKNILEQLDRIPEQVMIETMIVEASLDKSTKLGVEWSVAQPKAFGKEGVTGNASSNFSLGNSSTSLEGFRYTVSGGNISTFINALKTDDRYEVLSTPRIFTSNNVQAEINISQSIPYVLSTREDSNGNLSYNYSFQDVGIVLTVTPRITSNGYVTMEISQTANDLQSYTDFNAPIVNQRQADTTVSVKDGETIILGGIIRTQVTSKVKKLPLLGDLPFLGDLFKSTSKENTKTELLVFLRPSIIRDDEDARSIREKTIDEMSPGLKSKVNEVIVNKGTAPASIKSDKGNKPPAAPADDTKTQPGDKKPE